MSVNRKARVPTPRRLNRGLRVLAQRHALGRRLSPNSYIPAVSPTETATIPYAEPVNATELRPASGAPAHTRLWLASLESVERGVTEAIAGGDGLQAFEPFFEI
jgi:hypothetical protein